MHVWKMLENLTANTSSTEECIIKTQTDITHRRGRTCQIHNITKTPSHLFKARQQTIKSLGTKLFNKLPKSIRNMTNTSIDAFKSMLDKYLKSIEDLTSLGNTQPNWLYSSRPATVYEESPSQHSSAPSGIKQITAVPLINPVSEESLIPASGLSVEGLMTQMS